MSFRIDDMISTISRNGVSKESHFQLLITLPFGLSCNSREISLRAERCSLPGRSIMTIDNHREEPGPIRKIPYATMYQPIDVTFLCSSDLREKEIFEQWIDRIVGSHRTERNSGIFNPEYYENILGAIDIIQYNDVGNIVYETKCIEIFPLQMTALNMDWSSDGVHKLQMTFNYRYYKNKKEIERRGVSGYITQGE